MSERKKKKIETNNPLKLVHYEDGRLTIIDEVSSWDMHLYFINMHLYLRN